MKIYTDGACVGNPGPGGWGVVIVKADGLEEYSGHEPNTTNNRMELTAAIKGLELVSPGTKVEICSDSAYLVNCFRCGWLESWKKYGWRTANKKPVLNKDLWLRLDELASTRKVSWTKVKGHDGDEYNEQADFLAEAAARKEEPYRWVML